MGAAPRLIVGLGNPGRGYRKTRHNAGFQCLDHLAKGHAIAFDKRWAQARVGTGQVAGQGVVLAKPQTYVNLSGHAVGALMQRLRLEASHLVVIYDDLALPMGKIRLRAWGSAGGHKGMKSIIERLGTEKFVRIRLGIGPLEPGREAKDYVLSDFTPEERVLMEGVYHQVSQAIHCLLIEGIEAAMNRFNR